MQHCTKLPLLLANIRKYTESETERQMVTESIEKVETSLRKCKDYELSIVFGKWSFCEKRGVGLI